MIKFEWLFFEVLIIGLAVWELYSLSRDKKSDQAAKPLENPIDKR